MAYQGKFSQPRSSENPAPRRAPGTNAPASRPAAAANRPAPRPDAGRSTSAPRQGQPAHTPAPSGARGKKKASRTVSTVFYTLYFLLIIGFFGGMFFVTRWLDGWLVNYEAAQPTQKCEEVFNSLFANPDWGAIYDRSGAENTKFESRDTFISYMQSKTSGTALSYAETSAGLSGGHKYLIMLGEESLGYFTLVNHNENKTDIPDWQLSDVVMEIARDQSVLIQSKEGHTVFINGVALDESYVISMSSTVAQDYLPGGGSGIRTCLSKVDGLMGQPQITITNADGEASTVVYNEQTGIYEEQTGDTVMGPEQKEAALGAAENYALFMIAANNNLSRYFDTTSKAYKTITSMSGQLWVQSNKGHTFVDENVDQFCSYGEDLFSAHVTLKLNVTRKDDTIKEFGMDTTFFFEKQGSSWKCYNMTNVDVTEPISSVRLTFMNDGAVVSSQLYDSHITSLATPVLSAPEGKVFTGWVRESVDESGKKTLTLVFTPDENGNVTIPAGTTLEPMTLYPLFEAPGETGGAE